MVLTCIFTRTDRRAQTNQGQYCQVVHLLTAVVFTKCFLLILSLCTTADKGAKRWALWPNWIRHRSTDPEIAGSSPARVVSSLEL